MTTATKKLTYRSFEKLHPRLIKKLKFWANKRRRYSASEFDKKRIDAEVEIYITELVLEKPSQKTLVEWLRKLTKQEAAAIVNHIKFDHIQTDDRSFAFLHYGWYELPLNQGEYTVLDEEELDGFVFEGNQTGVVTKNSYDCEVLNTQSMMILDVDMPLTETCMESRIALTEYQAIAALKAWVEQNPEMGFRVYRTAAGLRHICTTEEFDPTEYSTRRLMQQFYTDPLYMRLCQFQECFRARLTPKPWRWDESDGDVSTCKLLSVVGEQKVIEPFQQMVLHHDERTGALSPSEKLA